MDLLVPVIHPTKRCISMDGPIPSMDIQATKHIVHNQFYEKILAVVAVAMLLLTAMYVKKPNIL